MPIDFKNQSILMPFAFSIGGIFFMIEFSFMDQKYTNIPNKKIFRQIFCSFTYLVLLWSKLTVMDINQILQDYSNPDFSISGEVRKGGLRKISGPPSEKRCRHKEHNPPMHISLSPGTYEYTCPGCGTTSTFIIPEILF